MAPEVSKWTVWSPGWVCSTEAWMLHIPMPCSLFWTETFGGGEGEAGAEGGVELTLVERNISVVSASNQHTAVMKRVKRKRKRT